MATPRPAQATLNAPAPATAVLHALFERYWQAYANLNPLEAASAGDEHFVNQLADPSSLQHLADLLALERSALQELIAIDPHQLGAADVLSYQIFLAERRAAIEGFLYPAELLALDPFDGLQQKFAQMAAGVGPQSFVTAQDFEKWIRLGDDFAANMAQLIANLREGLRRGYTVPKAVVERMLPALALYAHDDAENVFYAPLQPMAAKLGAADRARLGPLWERTVKAKILPAYAELARFLKTDYLPHARASVASSDLPLGVDWYAFEVRRFTDGSATPLQLHGMALAEVDRVRSRLQAAMAQNGLGGELIGLFESLRHEARFRFASGEELAGAFNDLQSKLTGLVPHEFAVAPVQVLEITAMPAAVAGEIDSVRYQPEAAPRPAVLLIETTDLVRTPRYSATALYLQEGVPGRHWQRAIQHENKSLPSFRRFDASPAFTEGWALYASSLGEELGALGNADEGIGALLNELRQDVLMVVDTGIQARNWTRQHAIDYVAAQLPISHEDAALQVDRCIAVPGQALAAPFGARQIRAARARAQEVLGAPFDVTAFHGQVLNDGAMPLALLESKLDRWMKHSH